MIQIPVVDGVALIFNIETVKLLRENYNICGVLVGILAEFPQQNIFGGLPLRLLAEDVKYLLEETNDFIAVDDTAEHQALLSIESPIVVDNAEKPERQQPQQINIARSTSGLAGIIKGSPAPPNGNRYKAYKYFLERGYFLMPGLRFGCHFMAYPGDLMRYHSHFNVLGLGWNEPFDLLDVIGAGRLATTVKKCWVVAAEQPDTQQERVFSVEWAGFG